MDIRIKLDGGIMPMKATPYDAAFDLYVPCDVELKLGRQVIDLGFRMEIPKGWAATIQPRSGFSAKGMEVDYTRYGYVVSDDRVFVDYHKEDYRLNADVIRGLIDSSYRGCVGVIIDVRYPIVESYERCVIKKGTRIAQMQIVEVPAVDFVEVDALDMSDDRGGGFGHTGV